MFKKIISKIFPSLIESEEVDDLLYESAEIAADESDMVEEVEPPRPPLPDKILVPKEDMSPALELQKKSANLQSRLGFLVLSFETKKKEVLNEIESIKIDIAIEKGNIKNKLLPIEEKENYFLAFNDAGEFYLNKKQEE